MASNYIRDSIEVLVAGASNITEELYQIREKFKVVRDSRNLSSENYERCKLYFRQTTKELCDLAKDCEKRYIGDSKETLNKNQREAELIARYEKKIDELKKELLLERKGKDEALSRVSALASQLLRPGNPNIADISDRNRPTRLAEDFKNLYDDEWTDAFEYLTEERSLKEMEATMTLYDLLKLSAAEALYAICIRETVNSLQPEDNFWCLAADAFALVKTFLQKQILLVCHDVSIEGLQIQYKQLEELVNVFKTGKLDPYNSKSPSRQQAARSPQPMSNTPKLQKQNFAKTVGSKPNQDFRQQVLGKDMANEKSDILHLESQLMEFRKAIAVDVLNAVTHQELIGEVEKRFTTQQDILKNEHVINYIVKCVKLCWLMRAQYPPMEIDFSHGKGEPLRLDWFKVYRTCGSKISNLVWPPLFLHHNGPLAGVGYADGDGS